MGEIIVNSFLLLLSLLYTICARGYSFGTLTAPKTGFLPQLVGFIAIIVSGYLLVLSLLGKGDAKTIKMNCDFRRLALLVLTMIFYIVLFKPLGYLISTILLLIITMKIGQVKGWKAPVIVSIITAIFFYMVFKMFLSVPLPTGMFLK